MEKEILEILKWIYRDLSAPKLTAMNDKEYECYLLGQHTVIANILEHIEELELENSTIDFYLEAIRKAMVNQIQQA